MADERGTPLNQGTNKWLQVTSQGELQTWDGNTTNFYEEGTWTPSINFATPGDLSTGYNGQVRAAFFRRVGSMVFVSWMVRTSGFTHTTSEGRLQLTGLPFTAINYSQAGSPAGGGVMVRGAYGAVTDKPIFAEVVKNTTHIQFRDDSSVVNASNATTGNEVHIKGGLVYAI